MIDKDYLKTAQKEMHKLVDLVIKEIEKGQKHIVEERFNLTAKATGNAMEILITAKHLIE